MIFYREKESKKSDKHSKTNIDINKSKTRPDKRRSYKRKTRKETVKKDEQFKVFSTKKKKTTNSYH